jgi:hypothetical protein
VAGLKPLPSGIVPAVGGPRDTVPQENIDLPWVTTFLATDSWRLIATSRNQYDWSFLDGQRDRAIAAEKGIILRIRTNFAADTTEAGNSAAPDFIFADAGGPCARRSIDDGNSVFDAYEPWTDGWKTDFESFVSALGQRYDVDPVVRAVVISGFNMKHPEITTRNPTGTWDEGFDLHGYIQSLQWTTDLFAKAFPHTLLLLRGTALNVPSKSRRAGSEYDAFFAAIDHIRRNHPTQVSIGDTGLSDVTSSADSDYQHVASTSGLLHHFQVGKMSEVSATAAMAISQLALAAGAHHLEIGPADWGSDQVWQSASQLRWTS